MTKVIDPILVRDTCFCFATRRAARLIAKRYDEAFRRFDLTNGQFSLLTAISADRSIGFQALADELGLDRTTLTAAIKPMERAGLIASRVDAQDRRSRHLALTAKGRALLAEVYPVWEFLQDEMKHQMGADLVRPLHRLAAALA